MRQGMWLRLGIGGLLVSALPAGLCFAQQQIISAQSGTVQYVEGKAYLNGKLVQSKFGQFPSMRAGDELRTEDGRAEVLLTPGAFLRLGENSTVQMVSNRLTDTRVEVVTGTVMLECDELLKDNAVALVYQGDTMQLEKHGLYRLDALPQTTAEFKVYEGEAVVQSASGEVRVRAGKETQLNGVLAAQHFNPKLDMDDFYHWSSQRSSNLAYATVTASQSVMSSGTPWLGGGGWMWSPLLDEYTFLPGAGLLFSPFGWGFYSPLYLYNFYGPGYYGPAYYGGGVVGGSTLAPTSGTGLSKISGSTNPKLGTTRPIPLLAKPGTLTSGTKYGGVAAATFRSGVRVGGSRSGSPSGSSPVNSANSNSSARSAGGLSSGGLSAGGFSGGGFHGGGGGHGR
jgi:hypothetical protein